MIRLTANAEHETKIHMI